MTWRWATVWILIIVYTLQGRGPISLMSFPRAAQIGVDSQCFQGYSRGEEKRLRSQTSCVWSGGHLETEQLMSIRSKYVVVFAASLVGIPACAPSGEADGTAFEPREVIDLGTVVTEDLPERVWGRALVEQLATMGFDRQNTFEVVEWTFGAGDDQYSGQNSYYEFFNHGGPHIDAPKHVSVGGGLDSYPIEAFSGPAKVFDAREYGNGRSIPVELFEGLVSAGDVVLVYCGYAPPQTDEAIPEFSTLTPAAAEYLATLPIRAYGTDALSVDTMEPADVEAETSTARAIPIHHAFLSRAIPIYEELFNMDTLIDRPESDALYFTGAPLSIQDGDGMLVRPVVFVY